MGGEMVSFGPVLLCWLERVEGRAIVHKSHAVS